MSKKKRVPKPPQTKKRLTQQTNQHPVVKNSDEEHPSFRFTYIDKNRWLLSDWQPSEITDLLQGLKKIEQYTWRQIKTHGSKKRGQSIGTGYKLIPDHPSLPTNVPEDAKLSEMRID
ncbi:MAG: hypothetical protein F6K24_52600 [Okeania sp. SIO2D1]|nr:hypothetical protein [Okeania sp. SIO2D1]